MTEWETMPEEVRMRLMQLGLLVKKPSESKEIKSKEDLIEEAFAVEERLAIQNE